MNLSLRMYSIGFRTGTTSATANHAVAGLWNPSSTKVVRLFEAWLTNTQAAVDDVGLIRTSARGSSPSATKTPTANSSWDQDAAAPPSGVVLDLGAFGTQPTLAPSNAAILLRATNLAASLGAGYVWIFDEYGLAIPPGSGVAIITPTGVAISGDVEFKWGE